MGMTDHINEVQKKLVTQYGFTPDVKGLPQNVPDGEYPMEINGRMDRVRITGGTIHCCIQDEREQHHN